MELIKKLLKNKKVVTALVVAALAVFDLTLDVGVIDAIVTLITASAEVAG